MLFRSDGSCLALVTVFFAVIEMLEHVVGHFQGNTDTDLLRRGYQGYHTAWSAREAPMVVRTLPEPPTPTGNSSATALKVREIDVIYQRAIAEQPDRLG